ncbi:hypothetical protein shim_17150 [Shimia sp. SK013]|nr:hypothetical protein shim_17150 [Shimia sp. SK013]
MRQPSLQNPIKTQATNYCEISLSDGATRRVPQLTPNRVNDLKAKNFIPHLVRGHSRSRTADNLVECDGDTQPGNWNLGAYDPQKNALNINSWRLIVANCETL